MSFKTAVTFQSFSLLVIISVGVTGGLVSDDDYQIRRANLLKNEEKRMLGGDIVLEGLEKTANDVLMRAKYREIDHGFNNSATFLPSQSFLLIKEAIRQSPVFKILRSMPKGSVLHVHELALVSAEYMLFNITYRPNLYAREIEDKLILRFFDKPPSSEYTLLSELRMRNRSEIDSKIRKQLLLGTNSTEFFAENDVDAIWRKFVSIFAFVYPILAYRPVYEDFIYQGLLEAYNDNILYLEFRSSLPMLYDFNENTYGSVEVAKICKNVTERFMRDHPDFVGIKLIYSRSRTCNDSQFEKYLQTARDLKKYLPDFIAGFDLVGQEDKGRPLIHFAEKLRSLIGEDIQLFFHAGETNWYGTSIDENLIDAVLLNTKRIGHGFALLKHPEVMDRVREKKIAIEVSPISNQVLGHVKDLRNHPANYLFANNYPVVVSNDDPGFWGAEGLSYDFYEAFVGIMSRKADLRALKKLSLNSIEYSSMNETQRTKALEVWNRKWKHFVAELSKSSSSLEPTVH
ncbi:adenosine deaminase 2-like [Planococcus citri]|uniref:adenosine deaminase 2-like n=1 Tax=Planococcus citri TaxID=170843 RepID=UPI0031F8FDBC